MYFHVLCSGISPPTAPPVASSLSCASYGSNNGQVTYGCTFSSIADCTPRNSAAVQCSKCIVLLPPHIYIIITVQMPCMYMLCVFGVCPGTIIPVCPVFALASKLMRAIWDAEVHSSVDLRVDEVSRSNKETMVRSFDCKGLHQLLNSFVRRPLQSKYLTIVSLSLCESSSMSNSQVHAAQQHEPLPHYILIFTALVMSVCTL